MHAHALNTRTAHTQTAYQRIDGLANGHLLLPHQVQRRERVQNKLAAPQTSDQVGTICPGGA